jgi:hypothetical protein
MAYTGLRRRDVADLPTERLPAGAERVFTFSWPETGHWKGQDFHLTVEESGNGAASATAAGA